MMESPSARLRTERYQAAWEKAGRQNLDAQESSNIYNADSDTQIKG